MASVIDEGLDVIALLRRKNPRLARRIPSPGRFLIRRIAREQALRSVLARLGDCTGCDFVERALRALRISVDVVGIEQLPETPRIVVCANHPTGGIDGLVLMALLCRRYGSVLAPANDLLGELSGIRPLIVPVDKYGDNSKRHHLYTEAYRSNHPLLVFPAGRTGRIRAGRMREYRWNRSFVRLARRFDRTIVPVALSGKNSWWFYAIWRVRRLLGLTINIEQFLLIDELLRQRGASRRIVVGAPRFPGRSGSDRRAAAALRRTVEGMV